MSEDLGLKAVFGADTSEFEAAAKRIGSATSEIGSKAQEAASSGSSSFGSMGGSVMKLAGEFGLALGAVELVKKGVELLADAFKEYAEHTEKITDLGAALTALGTKDVPGALKSEEAFADSMQDTTNVSRDQILGLEASAAAMGVHKDRLEETTKTAMGLSKVYGIDMKSALEYVVRAQQGNTTMLGRYIPELKNAGSAADKYALILGKAQVGLHVLNAETTEGAGPLQKLKLQWGDLMEKGGELIGKALNPIIEKFTEWMPVIKDVAKVIIDLIKTALDPLIGIVEGLFNAGKALVDLFKGDFKGALADVKKAATDVAGGMKDGAAAMQDAGSALGDAFNKGFGDNAKPEVNKDDLNKNLSITSGGAKDVGAKGAGDKIKKLTEIVDEATAHMKAFGDSKPEVLKKEISEISASMDKLFEKGKGGGAEFKQMSAALQMAKSQLANEKLNLKIIPSVDAKIAPVKVPIEPDNSLIDVQAKIGDITQKAVAAQRAFGGDTLSTLKKEMSGVQNIMQQMIDDGKNTGDTWDLLVAKQKQLKDSITATNAESTKTAAIAEASGAAFAAVGKGLAAAMSGQKVNIGQEVMKQLGGFAEQKGEGLISIGSAEIIAPGMQGVGALDLAAGLALIAAGAKMSATKMAAGGVVSGSAFVNVGEYPGAAHNPEVIAPLDKLKQHMGGGTQNHTFTVEGPRLVSVMDKVNTNTMFHIGGGGA